MSHNPEDLTRVHTYLNIIDVFLQDVPIQDVPVPDLKKKEETWEQFRADALQALEIIRTVLSPVALGRDPCPGKIIQRYILERPIKKT
jgi:hypothetical protein